jgi:uncharacterized membrane protein HdeD (DUF308 family)
MTHIFFPKGGSRFAGLTTTAVWLLGVLLGIQLICEGVALSSLAWQVRQSA